MVSVGFGVLPGPTVLDVINLQHSTGQILTLLEAPLALVLFTGAMTVRRRDLRCGVFLPGRLLGIGLPLSIAAGWLLARPLLPGLTIWELVLVGAPHGRGAQQDRHVQSTIPGARTAGAQRRERSERRHGAAVLRALPGRDSGYDRRAVGRGGRVLARTDAEHTAGPSGWRGRGLLGEVAVEVCGGRQGGVPQGLGDHGEWDARGDGDGGGQVSQVVNGDSGDACFAGEAVEAVEYQVWSEGAAVGPAEDQSGERIGGIAVGAGSRACPMPECGGDAGWATQLRLDRVLGVVRRRLLSMAESVQRT
jgi:hypothetical protein